MRLRASRRRNLRFSRILRGKPPGLCQQKIERRLLLEKVVEGAASIVRARGACGGRTGRRLCGGGSGVLFNRGANFVERAIVVHVFARDWFGHGLHALETRGAIEKAALFAAMQIESAARALRVDVRVSLQHGAATRAAHARNGANHSRGTRSELFLTRAAIVRGPLFLFFRLVGILVAVLPILPIQEVLRGDVSSYRIQRERT